MFKNSRSLPPPHTFRSDYEDHENCRRSNKLFVQPSGTPNPTFTPAFAALFQVLDNANANVAWFIWKYLDHIMQAVFYAQISKERLSFLENKLKTRSLHVYYGRMHIEYYNFSQQCEDYFAAARAIGVNQILFAAFFS